MQLGPANYAVGETDQRYAFELLPAPAAEAGLERVPLADGDVSSNCLNVFDLTDQLKTRLHEPSVAAKAVESKISPDVFRIDCDHRAVPALVQAARSY